MTPDLLGLLSQHKTELLALLASPTRESFQLVQDPADLLSVRQAVEASDHIGLDTETTGLSPRQDRLRLLSLATPTGVWLVDCFRVDPRPLWPALAEKIVVGHNLLFDLGFLAALDFTPGPVRDTLLLSRLLHGTRKARGFHGLAACAERELGPTLDKKLQCADWGHELTADQLAYAAADAAVLLPLYQVLDAKVREAWMAETADLESRCLPAVAWMARAGVAFDRNTWQGLAGPAEAEARQLWEEQDALAPPKPGALDGMVGWNWNSPTEVAEALARAGCPVPNTRDEALAAVNHPLAQAHRRYNAVHKFATTYGTEWLKHVAPDGRVYASWNQLGADSGRMSCAAPNLQQLPRGRHRRCVVAPPGRLLVKADYSQIELRIAAKVSGDPNMLAAYRDGQDLHLLTARRILGRQAVSKSDRQLAKSANFGLLYGMGAKGYQSYARSHYGVEMTLEQAQQYRRAFFDAYPGLRRWHGRMPRAPIDTRTLAGRRRLAVERFTEKLNTPVQGTGADGLKSALALLWERRDQAPGAFPILAVHDEIVVECDADWVEAAAAWLKQAMLDGMAPLLAPVPVEVEVTPAVTWGGDA
jgi:DNA polymerase-1